MNIKRKKFSSISVSMLVIFGVFVVVGPIGLIVVGDLPYYDIERDSLGNYHQAYSDNVTGNYEIYYRNDIGGNSSMDWNPPIKITNTSEDSIVIDLGIYLETDTIFIIWEEIGMNFTNPINYTYYTISNDYGANWTTNKIRHKKIMLKYQEFDPLEDGEPNASYKYNESTEYMYYIVQLKTPMYDEFREALENAGGLICRYIHDIAYLIWMNDVIKEEIEDLVFIRWVGLYHPSYKIQDDLLNKTGLLDINVIVFADYNKTANLNYTIQQIEALGGNITNNGSSDSMIQCQINASYIDEIASIIHVEWVEQSTNKTIEMDQVLVVTGADTLHDNDFDGVTGTDDRIIGGVMDIGIYQNHQEFDNTFLAYEGTQRTDTHGTACFGEIFSEGIDADAEGMLPEGRGVFYDWDIRTIEAAENLVDTYGGVFMSNSWSHGIYDGEYDGWSYNNDIAVYNEDITSVWAGGDSNGDPPSTDSSAKNVITVGSFIHGDNVDWGDDQWDSGGCQGPTMDGRIKPDLVAPGDMIHTSWSGTSGYTDSFSQTSAATPIVAGSAGLVYQLYRDNYFGNNPTNLYPHASTVKALLIANAHQYDRPPAGLDNADLDGRYQQGWGAPDLNRIFTVGSNHFIVDEANPLQQDDTISYSFFIQSIQSGPLKISLVWTDAWGTLSDEVDLLTNLDLKVTDPNGLEYWGNNGLLDNRWSDSGTEVNTWTRSNSYTDERNNVENVFIETPPPGEWTIDIYAPHVVTDDQAFGLVVSYIPNYYDLTLYPGWNLISLPLIQSQTDTQTPYNYKNSEQLDIVLRSITGNYDKVQYFDAGDETDPWKHYVVGKPFGNDLQVLGHRMGFWIHITTVSEITLRVYGWEFTSNQEIELDTAGSGGGPSGSGSGWNMVGYPSTIEQLRNDGLNNLEFDIHIDSIWYHNADTDTWHEMSDTEYFKLGKGYWFHYTGVGGPPIIWEVLYI